ncbi:hypothetical protein EUX98_g3971 [Antrodiella citrinella]|uniref:ATP-dependent RNA helicase n=1 Tax=Antrodiella citrinella TaxID=2447956 RepID=A0A4S4N388_9APHY|nr:hypothetical protein EUX98_g3971 [Antrodiella citrinella]
MSVLFKSLKLSAPVSARSLLRASRAGIILPRSALPATSLAVRWSSAAAAQAVEALESVPITVTEVPSSAKAAFEEPAELEEEHSAIEDDQPAFSTLEGIVSAGTLKAITMAPMSLTTLSPVQAAVLPLLPDLIRPHDAEAGHDSSKTPRDLLVKARTGTGKTIAFLVPAIEARLADLKRESAKAKTDAGMDAKFEIRARRQYGRDNAGVIIISPTRELATQIAVEATKLVRFHTGMQVHLLVGGESKSQQLRHWMQNTRDIIVATPGRLRDMMENEPEVAEPISKAKMLILDEADSLLEMGFREEVQAIAKAMPQAPERQTFLFSATVEKNIQQVARATLDKNHTFINCVSDTASPVHAHVSQHSTVLSSPAEQIPHVLRLIAHDQLTNPGKSKVLLFLPTTKMTQLYGTILHQLQRSLPNPRTRLYEIHSRRTQQYRTRMSHEFRNDISGASVLVSSDVSARGVDYPGVTRVIQVGIPGSSEQYVHRVGRTGRGKEKHGRADIVLLPWEAGFLSWQLTNVPMKPVLSSEILDEVTALTEKHDSESTSRVRFTHPYMPKLANFDAEVKKLQEAMDEDAVKETMLSLMGYYISRSGDLRCQKSVIIAGLKLWSVEAGGLIEPPYISDAFLSKLGAGGGGGGGEARDAEL